MADKYPNYRIQAGSVTDPSGRRRTSMESPVRSVVRDGAAGNAVGGAAVGAPGRPARRDYTAGPRRDGVDSHDVRRRWAERSGEYSPAYYAHYGPDETSESVRDILRQRLARDASVLELGCSSGRHLSHLFDDGFGDLSGVELNADAFDVMADHYPDLWEAGTFYADAIEDVVGDFDDDAFDAVYSVETLQHIHPDAEWVFEEIARITGDLVVTVEIEDDAEDADRRKREGEPDVNYVREEVPLYYRDWKEVFEGLGLEQVEHRALKRDAVRAFRAR